jgi:hypothetical protein
MSNAKNPVQGTPNMNLPIRTQTNQAQQLLVQPNKIPVYTLHQPNSISIAYENKKVVPYQQLVNQ